MSTDNSEHVHSRSNYQMKKVPGCEGCKRANAEYKRDKVAAHRELTASKVAAFGDEALPSLRHGKATTHDWFGCKCDDCTEAAREKWRSAWRRKQLMRMIQAATKEAVS